MNVKKVMFVLPRMNSGGAERVVSIIANNLAQRGYYITVVVLVASDSFYDLNEQVNFVTANIPVDRASVFKRKISLAKGFLTSLFFVRKLLKEIKPVVIVPLLTHCELLCYIATLGKSNVVRLSSERSDPRQRNFFIRKFKEFIYYTSSLLICQSKYVADYFYFIPAERKTVIPNPIDRSLFSEPVRESKPLKIVSVGRLTEIKNMSLLVRAFSLVADEYKDVTLTIYGEGPKRTELEEMIVNSRLQNRVNLPGAVPDVLNRIKDAAIFVMPSDFEGFPNALLEAIVLCIPVISTDFASGVAREIVTNKYGFVVPCRDEVAMAGAMRKLLCNDDLRKKIRAEKRIELKKYELDKVIDKWDKAITYALEHHE